MTSSSGTIFMTRVKPRAIRLLKHDRIKILSAVFVSLLASACASTQKVDRVHASIYHQQTSIQQLQSDMQRVEKQRLQVATELERLQQDGSSNQQQTPAPAPPRTYSCGVMHARAYCRNASLSWPRGDSSGAEPSTSLRRSRCPRRRWGSAGASMVTPRAAASWPRSCRPRP